MQLIDPDALAVATIIGEGESEGTEGQLAIAKVLRNRMRLKFYSDGTVAGTVLKPYQFSLWNTAELRRIAMCGLDDQDPRVTIARAVWRDALTVSKLPDGAVMYHTIQPPPGSSLWPPVWAQPGRGFREVARILHHVFYEQERH